MMIKIDLVPMIQWLSERWYRKSTLVILVLSALLVLLTCAMNFDLYKINLLWWIIIVVVLSGIVSGWLLSRKIPRTPKGRVGFLIAINHEDKTKQERFRNDFIRVLKNLLEAGGLKYQIKVVVLNEFHSSKIMDQETALYYLKTSHGHFILYGNIRERVLNNQAHHFLNLAGTVTHRPIPKPVSQIFSREFSELLPSKLTISSEGDVFVFEFTAQLIEIVARYIIGIASLMSGDYEYALALFTDLQERMKRVDAELPPISKIKVRLPDRLYQTYSTWMSDLYDIWLSTREKELLVKIENLAHKTLQIRQNDYPTLLVTAICCFVIRRDIKNAKRFIKGCEGQKDGTWLYSYAFLHAYDGNMKTAKKLYNKAFKRSLNRKDVPIQTEQFMIDVLSTEPDKTQLYYCLGLVNYHGKQDLAAAARDFSQFLAVCPDGKFEEEKQEAQQYLNNIASGKTMA